MMELVPALASRFDELGVDQHIDVLRDGLPRRRDAMLGREPRAQLEQGLIVPLSQLVEDRASGGVRQSLEDVTYARTLGKRSLAGQALTTRSRLMAPPVFRVYLATPTPMCRKRSACGTPGTDLPKLIVSDG